ncbi:MAG: hypothetical protein ACRDQE_12505 [Gaiellales bacterium]
MAHGEHTRTRWPTLIATGLAALAMLAVPSAAQAGGSILTVSPHHLKFGRQPFGSFTTRTVHIANRSSRTLVVTIADQSPDDFSPGQPESTCFLSYTVNVLEPGDRCTMIIGFEPSAFFAGPESASLTVTAASTGGKILRTRHVRITGVAGPAS